MRICLSYAASQTNKSLYQCQRYKGPLYFTPTLPSVYFNPDSFASANVSNNLTETRDGVTYVFPIVSEAAAAVPHCSGHVVAIQTCYQSLHSDLVGNEKVDFLRILLLVEQELQFNIANSFTIQASPVDSTCTTTTAAAGGNAKQICCETISNDFNNQFEITSSNFTFGVLGINSNLRPLHFIEEVTEYDVEQYQVSTGSNPMGSIPKVSSTLVTSHSLLLLRFVVGR